MITKSRWFFSDYIKDTKYTQEVNISYSSSESSDNDENILDNTSSTHYAATSPIISAAKVQGNSPILTQENDSDTSPIIGLKSKFRKKVHERRSMKSENIRKNIVESSSSPDLFLQKSQDLIDSESPTEVNKTSDLDEKIHIPKFNSSEETSSINTFVTSQSPSNLYYQLQKKRSRYKKGGLAHLFNKTLRNRRAKVAFFNHEVFLDKNIEQFSEYLQVINIINEYGCLLLESKRLLECEKNDIILVLVPANSAVQYKNLSKFKLYQPYNCRIIIYRNQETTLLFNICKIVIED